ncbi:hypothetical protein L9F63_014684, partial [Diploptera punctata]
VTSTVRLARSPKEIKIAYQESSDYRKSLGNGFPKKTITSLSVFSGVFSTFSRGRVLVKAAVLVPMI